MNEVLERVGVLAEFRHDTEPVLQASASREAPRRISTATVEQYDQVRAGNLSPAVAAFVRLFGLSPRGWSSERTDKGDHVLIKRWAKGQPAQFLRASYRIITGQYVFDEPREIATAAPQPLDAAFSTIDVNPTDLANVVKDLYSRAMARAADTLRRRTGAAFSVANVKRPEPPVGAFSAWPRKKEANNGN